MISYSIYWLIIPITRNELTLGWLFTCTMLNSGRKHPDDRITFNLPLIEYIKRVIFPLRCCCCIHNEVTPCLYAGIFEQDDPESNVSNPVSTHRDPLQLNIHCEAIRQHPGTPGFGYQGLSSVLYPMSIKSWNLAYFARLSAARVIHIVTYMSCPLWMRLKYLIQNINLDILSLHAWFGNGNDHHTLSAIFFIMCTIQWATCTVLTVFSLTRV